LSGRAIEKQGVAEARGRLLAVSPHLDDVVFGCGDVVAAHPGAVVVTIFAGGPSVWNEPTDWDAAAGFAPGEDAVARRREEDRAALTEIAARPVWLPFWDSQYGRTAPCDEIRAMVDQVIHTAAPDVVIIPLGLWHSDHCLCHQAVVSLVRRYPGLEWLAYEDAVYRSYPDSGLAGRLAQLSADGIRATPLAAGPPASAAKRRSISCYRSQLRALTTPGLPGWTDALEPERCWVLRSRQVGP
jgi:LmbE family N-acetylglucosaminyl deacetylase